MRFRAPLVVALCASLAGCGGSPAPKLRNADTVTRQCDGSKVAARREAQRRKLNSDLHRLRTVAATVKGYSQEGSPALAKAVDRFELDVAQEALPVFERSRFIDRAAAIVSHRCYLCFQALEANRPLASGSKLPCD
jgi:hypothetical protein